MRSVPMLMVSVALAAVACADAKESASNATEFLRANDQARDALSQHCRADAGSSACAAERDRYDRRIRPLLDRMHDMGEAMDACMRSLDRAESADLEDSVRTAKRELDRHIQHCCSDSDAETAAGEAGASSGEATAEDAELRRHCAAMEDLLDRQGSRARSMDEVMDDMMGDSSHGMMSGSGMMSGGVCGCRAD